MSRMARHREKGFNEAPAKSGGESRTFCRALPLMVGFNEAPAKSGGEFIFPATEIPRDEELQ